MKYFLLFVLMASSAIANPYTTKDKNSVVVEGPFAQPTTFTIICGTGEAVLHLDTQKMEYTKGCTPTDASDKFYRYVLKNYIQDCRK